MDKIICWFYTKVTGKSVSQLAKDYEWNYFITRSKIRSYWRTLVK